MAINVVIDVGYNEGPCASKKVGDVNLRTIGLNRRITDMKSCCSTIFTEGTHRHVVIARLLHHHC